MVKHVLRRVRRRRSSTPLTEPGKPTIRPNPPQLTRIDKAEAFEPITRPSSATGSRPHPSNKARKGQALGKTACVNQDSPPAEQDSDRLRITDILNSATEPPSPVCAMDPNAEEILHICPVNDCDCRKSLTPVKRAAQIPQRINDLRIILLVTSINSFTQLVYARLKERASATGDVAIKIFFPGTKCTNATSDLIAELVEFRTDIILCPFLTARIPADLYKRVRQHTCNMTDV
jgi:hypothetical protein